MTSLQIHGTCVSFAEGAVLIKGPSGAGKSDLAYRLVSDQGGLLVADDQVCLSSRNEALVAESKAGWQGRLELRGLGIISLPAAERANVVLLVELVAGDQVPRLPVPKYEEIIGHRVPVLRLSAFDATTAAKVRLAVSLLPERETAKGIGGGFPGDDGRLG
jgi:HPr kinase/phosphorylase